MHANGAGDVARARAVEAVASKQFGRSLDDILAAVAFISLLRRLAWAASRPLGCCESGKGARGTHHPQTSSDACQRCRFVSSGQPESGGRRPRPCCEPWSGWSAPGMTAIGSVRLRQAQHMFADVVEQHLVVDGRDFQQAHHGPQRNNVVVAVEPVTAVGLQRGLDGGYCRLRA